MNWTLLQNSLLTSASATALSVVLGFGVAVFVAGFSRRFQWIWLALILAALCIPPFVATNCWLHYLGNAGAWSRWLPWNIYSLSGTVWILAMLYWPIPCLMTLGAWQRLDTAHFESDSAVRGYHLLRWVLFPSAQGALATAAVLTFVLALNNFAVPAILQTKVFPSELWVEFNTTFNTSEALRLSWPMVVCPVVLLIALNRSQVSWPRINGTLSSELFRQHTGRTLRMISGALTLFVLLLSLALPVIQLASAPRTWIEFPGALKAGQLALWNSLWLATACATVCVVSAMTGFRNRAGNESKSGFLSHLMWLPFLIPGVLLGIALIGIFNRPGLSDFYQSAGIVVLALVIRYFAVAWSGVQKALSSVDSELRDAARLEGANAWQLLRIVLWPQVSRPLLAAWYVMFLLCLWDVESIVLIVPPGGETLALRIFNLLHYGHNAQVNSLCLALLLMALLPLLVFGITGAAAKWFTGLRTARIVTPLAILLCGLASNGCSEKPASEGPLNSHVFTSVKVIGSRGVGVGQFNKPRSIAVDHQDNVYVVDMTGRVQKFTPEGEYVLQWQMPQTDLGKPKGMGCDADGNIIVIEPHYQRINVFSPEGKLLTQWGHHGTNEGQLIMPRAVAMNSHGEFFLPEYTVVDRIQRFAAATHDFLQLIGHSGNADGEFNRPEGISIDSKDNLYVADSCNHRIQVFDPGGHWLKSYGKPGTAPGEMSYPYDVRVDKQGFQFVCEFENSRIQVFDTNNQPLEVIGGPGYAPGQFNNPYAIALDSHGNLYVADSQNHRVQKLIRRKEMALL